MVQYQSGDTMWYVSYDHFLFNVKSLSEVMSTSILNIEWLQPWRLTWYTQAEYYKIKFTDDLDTFQCIENLY